MSLPFIFLSPSKILSYLSFGNILLILSLLFYYGSNRFFGFLRDGKRFKITLSHILFIVCGLFFPMFQGYIFSFILDIALIITTVMFLLTIIPGGQRGIHQIQERTGEGDPRPQERSAAQREKDPAEGRSH